MINKDVIYINTILLYFILFASYSFLGWIIEVISCSTIEKRLCLNRGFLIGPYLPIFGIGSLISILFLSKVKSNIYFLFMVSVFSLTMLEYITSYLLEKIFHARWWNYDKRKFNIDGRVSLSTSFGFGVLSVILIKIVNPLYNIILKKVPINIINIISIVLIIIFLMDVVISLTIIFSLRKKIKNKNRDMTEELDKERKRILKAKMLLIKRLKLSFPNMKYK